MKNYQNKAIVFVSLLVAMMSSCEKENSKVILDPNVTTIDVSKITDTSAICGGLIVDDGGGSISAKGICWGTTTSPTIDVNKTTEGTDTNSFTSTIPNLQPNTTYYFRAYASNSKGTAYGTEKSFTTATKTLSIPTPVLGTAIDQESKSFKTVVIGNQTWMAENLNVIHYNDGTEIPNIKTDSVWNKLTTGAYCNYRNQESNADIHGRLYNWYAVNTEKICPTGWHVPSNNEWRTLAKYLLENGYNYDGTTTYPKIAKSLASISGWNFSSSAGCVGNNPSINNTTGFNGLPSCYRYNAGFNSEGQNGSWWTANYFEPTNALIVNLNYNNNSFDNGVLYSDRQDGLSVRCLKDK